MLSKGMFLGRMIRKTHNILQSYEEKRKKRYYCKKNYNFLKSGE